jgi:glycyl-tRNA synthetase beta chain
MNADLLQPLLIELFTEELPPKSLKALGQAFQTQIVSALQQRGLVSETDPALASKAFATPRRLSVLVHAVSPIGAPRNMEAKGPSLKVALDANGLPTQALIKWAEKQGASVEQLERGNDGKQDCFYLRSTLAGERLADIVQGLIESALQKLPIPKFMQYQLADGQTNVTFVRPAHRLTVMLGSQVLPCEVLGLRASNITQGHRFLGQSEIPLAHANDYEQALRGPGRVVANFEERKSQIREALLEQARSLGARLSHLPHIRDEIALDSSLEPYVDEVTSLVEWPKAYVGAFEERFLHVPQECLILTMRTNQKYFPLFDANGKLTSKFLIISNMDIADPSHIIDGNQRVVRPRLADAQFFFEQDKKQSLGQRIEGLGAVVYHAKLGTQAQRANRVAELAASLATRCAGNQAWAQRAALLAKTDLLTDMVGEFPELQGTMGRYYALHDGEPQEVCDAIAEHYQPRFSGDALPSTRTGVVLALADKLETLTGIWGIGMQPTGDRDPFALRRHALGVLRLLLEKQLPLTLRDCLHMGFEALAQVPGIKTDVDGLQAFIIDRLRGYLRDRHYESNQIEAVLAVDNSDLTQLLTKLDAVKAFAALPEAQALAAANKRIGNILRKLDGEPLTGVVDTQLLQEPAEQNLHAALDRVSTAYDASVTQRDFKGALALLAEWRVPVDRFFTDVMVMAQDPAIRDNRVQLLYGLHQQMNRIADISLLETRS